MSWPPRTTVVALTTRFVTSLPPCTPAGASTSTRWRAPCRTGRAPSPPSSSTSSRTVRLPEVAAHRAVSEMGPPVRVLRQRHRRLHLLRRRLHRPDALLRLQEKVTPDGDDARHGEVEPHQPPVAGRGRHHGQAEDRRHRNPDVVPLHV